MPQGWGLGVRWGFFSEIQPELVCELLTRMAHATGPRPLGPWGRAKRSKIIKSHLLSQFQRFSNQTLCVFSQIEDIKRIRRDFDSTTWLMPKGWDLGVLWGFWVNFFLKFNQSWCISYLHEWHMQQHSFLGPAPWGIWEGPKVKYH